MFHHTTNTSTTTGYSSTGRRLLAGVAVAAVGITAGSLTAHAEPGDNGGPGNSGAAKQCQQGGWADLAPSEAPTDAFVNQDACVSYAANGGVLTAHVLDPTITISFAPTGDPNYCTVIGTFDDFEPGTITVTYWAHAGGAPSQYPNATQNVTIGPDGTAEQNFASFFQSQPRWVQLATADEASEFTRVSC